MPVAKLAGRVLSGVAGLTVGFGRTAGRATGLEGIEGLTVGSAGRVDGLVTTPGVRLIVLFGIDGRVTDGVEGRVVGGIAGLAVGGVTGRVEGRGAGLVTGRGAGRATGRDILTPRASAFSTIMPEKGSSPQAMDQKSSLGVVFILFFSVKPCYNNLVYVGQHDAIHHSTMGTPCIAILIDRS